MTSVSGPRLDPAPLFDLVTGFPPDDALDVVVPIPLSLAVYMTMLESTGHAAELAVLRKLHIDQARETVRGIQAGVGPPAGSAGEPTARLRITHIVEERVPGVNGLRPHVHAYVGATLRSTVRGQQIALDAEQLRDLAESSLFAAHRDGLVAATTERAGLTWGPTAWSSSEVVGPAWLAERTEQARHDDVACPGPWPRPQILAGPPA